MAIRHNTIESDSMSTQHTFVESKMQVLMFAPLNSDGSYFLEWVNDVRTILSADDLARTLTTEASTSIDPTQQIPPTTRWQTLLLLRRHLDHALRLQYLQFDDLAELWAQLHS